MPVGVSRYRMPSKRQKIVHYWAAEATDAAIRASAFVPNKEIAALEWVTPKKALKRLSYPVDVEILEHFVRLVDEGVLRTFPIIALRHAQGLAREEWDGKDAARPLSSRGRKQANSIVGPAARLRRAQDHLEPGDALREDRGSPCRRRSGARSTRPPLISQDAWEEGRSDARTIVGERVRARKPAVLCSHGPVLPEILTEIALATGTLRGSYLGSASALEAGAFSVVHMSVDNPGSGIVAIETHEPKV